MSALQQAEAAPASGFPPKITARKVNVHYGEKRALYDVDLDVGEHEVTALIGPSGCGKSTFLRCLNRMNDVIEGARVDGEIKLDGRDIYDRELDVVQLRARVGMVFQKPNPFPKSIFENVAYGLRLRGTRNRATLAEEVEKALRGSAVLAPGVSFCSCSMLLDAPAVAWVDDAPTGHDL